jgi:hypothetical protein
VNTRIKMSHNRIRYKVIEATDKRADGILAQQSL